MEVLYEIAAQALKEYDVAVVNITFIAHSANAIFKIIDDKQRAYVLRIHRSKSRNYHEVWQKPQMILSEMMLLNYLSQTPLQCQQPFSNRNRSFLTILDDIPITVLSFEEGNQKDFINFKEDAAKIGFMIGQIHQYGSFFPSSDEFIRPEYNLTKFTASYNHLLSFIRSHEINPVIVDLLTASGAKALDELQKMDLNTINKGIIHGDLTTRNYLFKEHRVVPIDFGLCGFGSNLYDLACAFVYIKPNMRKYLLEAYDKIYHLPLDFEIDLQCFYILGQIENMYFWAGIPEYFDYFSEFLEKAARNEMTYFLNGQNFLY